MEGETASRNVVVSRDCIAKGDWLSFSKLHYHDSEGVLREYESTERTTRPAGSKIDSVTIIATLKRALHFDCLVLVKQFRPPAGKHVIEFPSGLIEAGETATEAALRELREETGYVGTETVSISPVVLLDPGASDTAECLVHVIIDGDEEKNLCPKQELDTGEYAEVLIIPIYELYDRLLNSTPSNIYIDSRLMTYALAISHQSQKVHNNHIS